MCFLGDWLEPLVVSLLREDFNAMSNRQLVSSAVDKKLAIRCFFEQAHIDAAVLFQIETPYGIKGRYFDTIDFSKPRLIYTIEDYVIGGSRKILEISSSRGITTAIKQIFGKGALDLIAEGEMALPNKKSRNGAARIDLEAMLESAEPARGAVVLPFSQLRRA